MKIDFNALAGFEWNKGNLEHIKKHNVDYNATRYKKRRDVIASDYRECEEVFVNTPLRLNEDKKHSKIEERLQVLGKTNNQRLLFIAFTIRKNKVRVVSARNQSKKERREYEKIKNYT